MKFTITFTLILSSIVYVLAGSQTNAAEQHGLRASELEKSFQAPPDETRSYCYWWWIHGCVTKEGIIRDLDHMKAKGIGGAMVNQFGLGKAHVAPTAPPPFKTDFMSPQWRELFKFAVAEAARRGIVIGVNLCAGFDAGGPWVKAEEAPQFLSFRAMPVQGPRHVTMELPSPKPAAAEFYRDVAVLAWQGAMPARGRPGTCRHATMVDLTGRMAGDRLDWDAPAGNWVVMRVGHNTSPNEYRAHVKFGDDVKHWEIDPLRPDMMERHFEKTAGVLIRDLPEHAGKTFQFVQIDSSEIAWPDWTPAFREEFKKRRGYDPMAYLAARARFVVDSPEITERFNEDFERTRGDLMAENYYGKLSELARRHGLVASSQGAGFQKPRVDALRALGCNDVCESEYWSRNSEADDRHPAYLHQLTAVQLQNHDGIKTAASAAHIYGRRIVMAEAGSCQTSGFPNYDKYPFALKDVGDRAFCAGLNRNLFLLYVHQPFDNAFPGFAFGNWGTDISRNVTWWTMGEAWQTYLARCQAMLQAGRFAADVCYFSGEWVPNFIPARWAMRPVLPAGFDCDTINAEILNNETGVAVDGRLALKSGMRYRYLVLNNGGRWTDLSQAELFPGAGGKINAPRQKPIQGLAVSPATLAKIKTLVENGVTLIGPPPARAIGLSAYPDSDAEVARLAAAIWGGRPARTGERKIGKGRVIWGKPLGEIFRADGLAPDLMIMENPASKALPIETMSNIPNPGGSFDWIHRTVGDTELYFIANLRNADAAGEFTFRVADRMPQLWDPVTGKIRVLPEFRNERGRTVVPLRFAPRQSGFLVFSKNGEVPKHTGEAKNFPETAALMALTGPWEVQFDPQWFYPENGTGGKVRFDHLQDWTTCAEDAIRHYSGLATYRKNFDLPGERHRKPGSRLFLDLGTVKIAARVRLNGQALGVLWTAPWRVEITDAVKEKDNALEIEVVNLWPNRMIGDVGLPLEMRRTRTNLLNLKPDSPLFPSGLLGPVALTSAPDSLAHFNPSGN